MVFVNEITADGKWQTIDREKNIILRQNGRSSTTGPYKFIFNYGSQEINFEAILATSPFVEKEFEVSWDVVSLYIPEELNAGRENILIAVHDALNEYGASASKKYVKNVTVTFSIPEI